MARSDGCASSARRVRVERKSVWRCGRNRGPLDSPSSARSGWRPISKSAKIPADLAANPALLSPDQVAALLRPDLELSAKKFGEYKNLANQQLKS